MDANTVWASVAGMVVAEVVFHPVDTLRTLRQTTARPLWGHPLRTYWNGLVPAMSLTVPAFTVYLTTYRQTKAWLAPRLAPDSLANYVASAAAAELASSFLWTPLEVLKGRMQLAGERRRPVKTVVRDIVAREGFRGLYRGYWMGIAVFLPKSVVWWVAYEHYRAAPRRRGWTSDAAPGAAAAAATVTASATTNLLEVVKTRQQLAASDDITGLRPTDRQGVGRVLVNLVREHGLLRAMTRGLGVSLMCSVPASALTMSIVEYLDPDKSAQEAVRLSAGPVAEA